MQETAWALVGGFSLCGLFCAYLAAFARSVPRNHLLGLRSSHTMSSDAAWRSGHVAAARWMGATALTCFLGAAAAWVFAHVLHSEQLVDGMGLPVVALVAGLIIKAQSVASSAARATRLAALAPSGTRDA